MSVAVLVTPPETAVMVTELELVTAMLEIVNVALVLPLGTVTPVGRLAAGESSLSVMLTPPVGAGPLNVTVPRELFPPTTTVGLTVTELRK